MDDKTHLRVLVKHRVIFKSVLVSIIMHDKCLSCSGMSEYSFFIIYFSYENIFLFLCKRLVITMLSFLDTAKYNMY